MDFNMEFFKTKNEFFTFIGTEWETFNIEDFTCSFYISEQAKYIYRDDQDIDYLVSEKWASENGLLKKAKKKDDKK
jgi:hypothetical protein